jgi:hypothetical protein
MSQPETVMEKIIGAYKRNEHFNREKFARDHNCNVRWVRRVIKRFNTGKYPTQPHEKPVIGSDKIKQKFKSESGTIEVNSFTCHTIEQAMDLADIDVKKWQVDRYEINNWQVTVKLKNKDGTEKPETKTNWQVKMWLKPRIVQPLEIALRNLIKDIPKFTPVKSYNFSVPKGDLAGEMALYDAHIGKLAWKKEVTQGDYDLPISGKVLVDACEKNLNHLSPYKLSKIYYVLGNDYMHIENYMGVTPAGKHHLDTDSRLPKVYTEAKKGFLKTVYMCRQVAPVEILWIPGNHDMHASFFLSEVIKEHFRKDKHVTVDNSPEQRKARLWGNLLVGFAHDGSKRQVNFVNVLPHFFPDLWGKSKFREWHVGHKHKKEVVKYFPTQTSGGTIIRQIPTLSTIDFWHYDNIFVDAVPAGESFVWDKGAGIISHHTANVKYE